jgi:glycosidase
MSRLAIAAMGVVALLSTNVAQAFAGDGDVHWDGLRHDSFDPYYRSPFGAVTTSKSVTLRFRTFRFDVDSVSVRIYRYDSASDRTSAPTDMPMTYMEDRIEDRVTYAIWSLTLQTPAMPSILYYKFRVADGSDVDWYSDTYSDPHDNLGQGGGGAASDDEQQGSYQITVYDPAFQTATWLKNASVYQIFPDRFRNGDPTNDYCRPGSTTGCPVFYGNTPATAHSTWNEAPEDGRKTGAFGRDFFGGDLKGIEDKLDYIKASGFDTIYLNPIFVARSNHRYDTDDYMHIDPALGGDAALASLTAAMKTRGMHLVLDGVFNHTSSDSKYFDRYHRYPTDGACESLNSPTRSWFDFNNAHVPCGAADYPGWAGYDSLAQLADASPAARDFIYRTNTDNVVKHWYDRGASGWRFDVADEISHNYWRDFRPRAKADKANGPLVGEVWYDASPYLLGDQLDSVMNYRFRKNVLGFARGGAGWVDNDSNGVNNMPALSPSQFDHALKAVLEDYPTPAAAAMFNLLDSHDTNRAKFVLTLLGDNGQIEAKQRLELAALFQFSYLGAPTVYYGDEAALHADSLANGPNGPEDDPYNRAPYPWSDQAGNTSLYGPADVSVTGYYSKLSALRKQHAALRTGSVSTLLIGDVTPSTADNNTYAFARVSGTDKAVAVLNNGTVANTAAVPVARMFTDGTQLQDGLTGKLFTVTGGVVNVNLAPRTGTVLVQLPKLNINNVSVLEGTAGTRTSTGFKVTLSPASTQTVAVAYRTSDGTARSTSDYMAKTGTVTFTPGQSAKTVSITVIGDDLKEGDESFSVNLSAPVNARITIPKSQGTIRNDDA